MPTKRKRTAKKRAPAAPPSDFAIQLAAHVAALDPGGAVKAAEICQVSRRVVDKWTRGQATPIYPARVGAIALLSMHASNALLSEPSSSSGQPTSPAKIE